MVLFSFLHILLFHCFTAFRRSLISVVSPVLSLTYLTYSTFFFFFVFFYLLFSLSFSFFFFSFPKGNIYRLKSPKPKRYWTMSPSKKNKVTPNLLKKTKKTPKRSFRMCTGISRIAQHKDVPRHGVKDGLQRHSGISTSNDGGVRRLSQIYQVLTHLLTGAGIDLLTFDEALISFLRFLAEVHRMRPEAEGFSQKSWRTTLGNEVQNAGKE